MGPDDSVGYFNGVFFPPSLALLLPAIRNFVAAETCLNPCFFRIRQTLWSLLKSISLKFYAEFPAASFFPISLKRGLSGGITPAIIHFNGITLTLQGKSQSRWRWLIVAKQQSPALCTCCWPAHFCRGNKRTVAKGIDFLQPYATEWLKRGHIFVCKQGVKVVWTSSFRFSFKVASWCFRTNGTGNQNVCNVMEVKKL